MPSVLQKGNNRDDSSKDKKTVCAVSKAIKAIGEEANKIPDSVRKRFPEIP